MERGRQRRRNLGVPERRKGAETDPVILAERKNRYSDRMSRKYFEKSAEWRAGKQARLAARREKRRLQMEPILEAERLARIERRRLKKEATIARVEAKRLARKQRGIEQRKRWAEARKATASERVARIERAEKEKRERLKRKNLEKKRAAARKLIPTLPLFQNGKALQRKRDKKKERSKPQNRIRKRLSKRLTDLLFGRKKSASTTEILGCSGIEIVRHLESQFQDGMSWQNYGQGSGKWEIDHIIPLAWFDLTDREQLMKAGNHRNLRPLWSEENHAKGGEFCPELVKRYGIDDLLPVVRSSETLSDGTPYPLTTSEGASSVVDLTGCAAGSPLLKSHPADPIRG